MATLLTEPERLALFRLINDDLARLNAKLLKTTPALADLYNSKKALLESTKEKLIDLSKGGV